MTGCGWKMRGGEPGRSSQTGIRGDGGNRGGSWEHGSWSQEGTREIQGGTRDNLGAGESRENEEETRGLGEKEINTHENKQ